VYGFSPSLALPAGARITVVGTSDYHHRQVDNIIWFVVYILTCLIAGFVAGAWLSKRED
jgi:hypothetical protein